MDIPVEIPSHVLEDEELCGRMKVCLAEALSHVMDDVEWRKFSAIHGLSGLITNHPRFLRSLSWGDPDHESHVLSLVEHLFDKNLGALSELLNRPKVIDWIKSNQPTLLDRWTGSIDPLVAALSHSVSDVDAVKNVIDISEYVERIQGALPHDPHLAIGATKDMLEATMRTVLHRRGHTEVEHLDFPALATQCMTELGLIGNARPATDEERHIRKIASSAKTMIEAANNLRNLAGTGHGRVVGLGEKIQTADASLVASCGLILAAWILRHHDAGSH